MGIIDFLTEYSCKKSVERVGKSIIFHAPMEELSVAPPNLYGKRFFRFMMDNVFSK